MSDYTKTLETVNGVEVTVYGGTKRPVLSYALPGHVTGWQKRDGARTTYAELTCTCHLTGEAVAYPGPKGFVAYGEEGWRDRLNALALAHVENVTANAFFFRPAGGDRSRWADRTRVTLEAVRDAIGVEGVACLLTGGAGYFVAKNGDRFELAPDRSRWGREPLPVR